MNDLQMFLKTVKDANGHPVSLRSVFPGRGRRPTDRRAEVKKAFAGSAGSGVDGVQFDTRRGVFYAA